MQYCCNRGRGRNTTCILSNIAEIVSIYVSYKENERNLIFIGLQSINYKVVCKRFKDYKQGVEFL